MENQEVDHHVIHFEPSQLFISYTVIGAFTMVFGLLGQFIRLKTYLSQILLATVCGIIIGPYVANIVNPAIWDPDMSVFLEFSRLTLIIQIMTSAIDLPTTYVLQKWQSLFVLLFPVLGASWMITAGLTYALLPLSFLHALLIGACLTSTDPVLSLSVIKGEFSEKHVPSHLRRIMTAESGINDGAAFPFVFLPLLLLTHSRHTQSFSTLWLAQVWAWQVCFGVFYGACFGYLAARFFLQGVKSGAMEKRSLLAFTTALPLLCMGSTEVLGSASVLAVFTAATMFSRNDKLSELIEQYNVPALLDCLDLLVSNVFFIYLGTILPWNAWAEWSAWKLVVLCLTILMFRRVPVVLFFYPIIPALKNIWEAVFVGWFGPMGVAAIFYAVVAFHQTGDLTTFHICTAVAFSSIVAHGLTTIPFTKLLTPRHTTDEVKPVTETIFRRRSSIRTTVSASAFEVLALSHASMSTPTASKPTQQQRQMPPA
eukprot:GILJ01011557.1.p1 GENE.GILJ01011557.1~~GILJ01011557.1.p1  ORF type:complete len:507 (+),score=50.93 GILJ01011557.1:75-1523(+)